MTLVAQPSHVAEKIPDDREPIKVGQWYWCRYHQDILDEDGNSVWEDEDEPDDDETEVVDEDDDTKPAKQSRRKTREIKLLVCVTEVGSNYAQVTCVNTGDKYSPQRRWREHLDTFDEECTRALNPEIHIKAKIEQHQQAVMLLCDEARRLAAGLGVPLTALPESQDNGTALATASGTADIKAHKAALIKAQKETLPEIFKRIEKEHEQLAIWMKADLIPAQAELATMKGAVARVEDRIFTVELYAGLVEELLQIAKGKPATIDAKIHLFQRRHYMDEECLARYEAGGMEFDDIGDFDKWLKRVENRNRILPHARSIVAFRVRRNKKDRGSPVNMSQFWEMQEAEKYDKTTFLYIRNGEQLWRLTTEIEFDEQLFPDREAHDLLGEGNLWIYTAGHDSPQPITQRQHDTKIEVYFKALTNYRARKKAWKALSAKEQKENVTKDPDWSTGSKPQDPRPYLKPCTPDHIYYDDVMAKVSKAAKEHNRIAVVVQGIIDRSPAVHPHPPWKLWKQDGFANAIELVYDDSRAITVGEPLSFASYCAQLGKSLKVGALVIGQRALFGRREAIKENARRDRAKYDRYRSSSLTWHFPRDNVGPTFMAKIEQIKANGMCLFSWERERERTKYKKTSYIKDGWRYIRKEADESKLPDKIWIPRTKLFNVSAYTPGDYRLFFDDPRTRADYLKWAPFLLAAEDFHAGQSRRGADRSEIDYEAIEEAEIPEDNGTADADVDADDDDDDDDDDEGTP